jgi:hypothetical protein
MIPTDLSPLANHLWQSTLFTAAAWVLTLVLRKNCAGVRYRIWLTASVKFLVPFSLLVNAGSQFEWRAAPAVAPVPITYVVAQISQPFALQAGQAPPKLPRPRQIRFQPFCSASGFAVLQ